MAFKDREKELSSQPHKEADGFVLDCVQKELERMKE